MSDPLFTVEGQVVLVSGGSRGIGRAIAEGFAERGARVIITGRDPQTLAAAAAEIQTAGDGIEFQVCDVADPQAVRELAAQVLKRHGRIDTLVNVAGVNRRKPALEVTEDDYDFILDVNLKGAFLLSQAAGRAMVERGSGCQINIASLNSDRPLRSVLPYAVSKAGLAQMTRALALEWGPRGVRVNALAPGFILTDLTEKLWSDPTMQAWGAANTPQGRLGRPADLVGTAIFLASPAAAFLTGQVLYVDGGFTCGWAWPIPAPIPGSGAKNC
jgi:NAD(P)-dependent dehydrogenase (short-subunit alcohol dehydrogenase family)